jgi:hypothetical protein
MWQILTRDQIENAKHDLKLRREQALVRHAAEIGDLDAERSEIEILDQMATAFAGKFKRLPASPSVAVVPEETDGTAQDSPEVATAPKVSFFITQAQKSKLRELGIADEQIRDMKPSEAHRILGLTRRSPC